MVVLPQHMAVWRSGLTRMTRILESYIFGCLCSNHSTVACFFYLLDIIKCLQQMQPHRVLEKQAYGQRLWQV